jgi:hypothetical protein
MYCHHSSSYLPPCLCFVHFHHSEILLLDNNNFRGALPGEIFFRVNRLTELHLSANEFDGTLPTSLGRLKDLSKYIYIYILLLCRSTEETMLGVIWHISSFCSDYKNVFWLHTILQNHCGWTTTSSLVRFRMKLAGWQILLSFG